MWRIIRFLLTGDAHHHQWRFTGAISFDESAPQYVKMCSVCGVHKSGKLYSKKDVTEELKFEKKT